MAATVTARPDTHEMVVIHRVFRREFRLLPDLVEAVAAGDTNRAAVLVGHAEDVTSALHHHHHSEDELLWPRLLQRASVHTELIERMEGQHQHLGTALDEIHGLLPRFAADAAPDVRDRLAAALRAASVVLDEHLAEEEREILPLAAEHLSVEEWEELGKRGADSIPKQKLLVFLGMILEDADPGERRDFLAKMPMIARLMWSLLGQRKYGAYVTGLRTA